MIIAMSCTKDWYYYLMVDLYSLLECTKNIKKIYLLLETEEIDNVPYLKKIIKKYNVEIKLINLHNHLSKNLKNSCPNLNTIYSNFSFAKLMLSDIVEEDKVLYIDTDAIVRKDISNIWNYDITDYYIAGVKDYGIIGDGIIEQYNITGKYINSGFIIFNLEKIRKNHIQSKWFKIINNQELTYPDQDALNIVCQHKELYLPSVYNYCYNLTLEVHNTDLIKVFHYMGPKKYWIVDHFNSEEWYDAEERFYTAFNSNRKTKDIIISMSCNEKWYNHLVVSIYSLLKYTKNIKKLYLIVETEDINNIPYLKQLKETFNVEIELIDFNKYINNQLKLNSPNKSKRFTDFTFGRLLMPDIIKEKKIIYIDTDMIIKKDISTIWRVDISNSYIAGAKDYGIYERKAFMKKFIKEKYINAGFSIWNLDKIRKDNIHKKCFELINKKNLPYPDQDALNILCKDNITYIPSIYNVCNLVTLEVSNKKLAKIYHFAGEKTDWVVDQYYSEEWYEEEEEFYNKFQKNNK